MEFELYPWKEDELNLELMAHCREFNDYYEYCFINDYEEKYGKFHVHSIQLGHVFACILETKGKHVLVSAQFFKDKFTLHQVGTWMDEMGIYFKDTSCTSVKIPKVSRVVDAVRFKGRPIVIYQKGHKTLDFGLTGCTEVSDIYQSYDYIVNTAYAADVDVAPCKVTLFLNRKRLYSIPRIDFDLARGDVIICNGMVVVADFIENYCGTVGVTQTDNAALPVTFFHDDDTPIYIGLRRRPDGTKVCIVNQSSVPYDESVLSSLHETT